MISDTETLDDHLKTHADLIKQLKSAYGEAAEGVDQYARESTAVLESQIRASIIKLEEDLDGLAKKMARAMVPVPEGRMTNIGTIEVDLAEVNEAQAKYEAFAEVIRRFREELAKGEPDIRAFRAAVSEIANQNLGDEEIQKLAEELRNLADEALTVENNLSAARRGIGLIGDVASGQIGSIRELTNALSELGRIGMPNLTDREKAVEAYRKAIGAAGGAEERRAAQSAYDAAVGRIGEREAEKAAEEARRKAERDARSGARRGARKTERIGEVYDRELQDIQNSTRALELEFEMLGKSNVERERARMVMEVENALRREGVTLSDDQRVNVEQLAQSYAEMSEKLRAVNATQQELQQLASSTMKGFVSDLMNGVSAAEALQNALSRVADKLLDMAINSLFDTKNAGSLGGLILGAFNFGGGKASGGPVQAGKTYLVGEEGPELVHFRRNGTVVPNHALKGGSGGGGTFAPVYNIDARGAQAGVADQILHAIKAYDAQLNKTLPSRISDINVRFG
jgi:hypothetical protein